MYKIYINTSIYLILYIIPEERLYLVVQSGASPAAESHFSKKTNPIRMSGSNH